MVLFLLAPLFILFELFQLVLAERYIGVKQIRKGEHPLDAGAMLPDWLALTWITGIILTWFYMVALLWSPLGSYQGLGMLLISLLGLVLRRSLGLKYALVVMTVEGAVRMGLLANMLISHFLFEGRQMSPGLIERFLY